METIIRESSCERDTYEFGLELGANARPGRIYILEGDLGAGKTIFAKGFAKGLGIDEPITSPTYTIVREYDGGRLTLYHLDVYRIGDVDEMEEVGVEDMFASDGVCLIEWGSLIEDILPDDRILIRIERTQENLFDHRRITCSFSR